MSFCEECFEVMPGNSGAWSLLCHKCEGGDPESAEIRTLYGRAPFGVWDHLRNFDEKEIPIRAAWRRRPEPGLHFGAAECEDNLRCNDC